MRVKFVQRFCSQPTRLSCQNSALRYGEHRLYSLDMSNEPIIAAGKGQRGASTLLLALFVVVVLVTATVGLLFGHKLGYQRGFHSMQTETKQAMINSSEATKELEKLRLSNKIATKQSATSKQELAISLANIKELRENQKELTVENRQLAQLNEAYAEIVVDQGGMPLKILGAKIKPLPENSFEYGFDVGMLSSDGQAKRLQPTLTLLNDNSLVEVPLDPAVYTIDGITRIRGRFTMPTGFRPLQVKLNLQAGGQKVEQLYNWSLGASVDNMPLSLLDLSEVDESPIEP
ncbi:hypothetical protein A3K91_0834 [Psychrobacter alimentarius]|uniref:Uncharacterized protein n=2 Tax=Moraxellaceae TaxID=468 RepID=A0ABM5ZWJ4_9GAMM|nr:hypothetical protein A3K91_0834 [Psychrobacter alimentarius]QCB31156.1 hypothetical protein E5677_09205 [Psychrobacter sp. PAMC27889]